MARDYISIDGLEVERAGDAINQGNTKEQKAGGKGSGQKIFHCCLV